MFRKSKKLVTIALLCTYLWAFTSPAHATWWLFRRRPACPQTCAPTFCATQCVQRVCRYVPQTCYRNVSVNVPVTTYKPTTTCDPCTGCRRTCWRPTTTYVRQVRRVPYTTYRPVVQYVRYGSTFRTTTRGTSACSTGNCSTGAYASASCATGNCGTGNYGTGIISTPTQGLTRPALKPNTTVIERSTLKKEAEPKKEIQKKLDKTITPIPDNNSQKGPLFDLRPVRSPRIHRSNSSNKTAMAPVRQVWHYTPVSWAEPQPKQAAKVIPAKKVDNQRDTSGWVISQD